MRQPCADNPTLSEADLSHCRDLLSGGSRSFYAASLLLPRRVRDPATALYAFCRIADDAIDAGQASDETLDRLNQRLDRAYRGDPEPTPVDRAFSAVIGIYGIPREIPDALIEGFSWDAAQRRYETIDGLIAYATRVAGTVGAMMAILMGANDEDRLARACDLGIAMQLTNIARDVGEDARAGRIYLPLNWMHEAGVDPDRFIDAPSHSHALGSVVARLLAVADEYYRRSEAGIARLPADCRAGIYAARLLYSGIGSQVARNSFDAISERAVVSPVRKVAVLPRIIAYAALPQLSPSSFALPAAPQARFLVNAARRNAAPHWPIEKPVAWWNISGRLVKAIELFDALERRERDRTEEARRLSKNLISVPAGSG